MENKTDGMPMKSRNYTSNYPPQTLPLRKRMKERNQYEPKTCGYTYLSHTLRVQSRGKRMNAKNATVNVRQDKLREALAMWKKDMELNKSQRGLTTP